MIRRERATAAPSKMTRGRKGRRKRKAPGRAKPLSMSGDVLGASAPQPLPLAPTAPAQVAPLLNPDFLSVDWFTQGDPLDIPYLRGLFR